MDLDMGLGPQGPQFLEAPMVDEEWGVFEDIMEDGAGMLAEAFMENLVWQAPGVQSVKPQVQDVVFEDELLGDSEDEEEDMFDLF